MAYRQAPEFVKCAACHLPVTDESKQAAIEEGLEPIYCMRDVARFARDRAIREALGLTIEGKKNPDKVIEVHPPEKPKDYEITIAEVGRLLKVNPDAFMRYGNKLIPIEVRQIRNHCNQRVMDRETFWLIVEEFSVMDIPIDKMHTAMPKLKANSLLLLERRDNGTLET